MPATRMKPWRQRGAPREQPRQDRLAARDACEKSVEAWEQIQTQVPGANNWDAQLTHGPHSAMMDEGRERGVGIALTTILSWVQRYTPEFEKRWHRAGREDHEETVQLSKLGRLTATMLEI